MKNVLLFHLKSSFRSQDIQISEVFSLPFPDPTGQMKVE